MIIGDAAPHENDGPKVILARLRESPLESRRPRLIRFIEAQLLEVLRWDESRRRELGAGFIAIGMDSLMAVDLQFRLQTALNFALPDGEGFELDSVEELADLILRAHLVLD
jgi:acyl carrier protein